MYSSQEWWSDTAESGGGNDPGDPILGSLRFRGQADNKLQRQMPSTVSDNWSISFWCRSACSFSESPNSIRPHWMYIAGGDSGSMELIDDDWYDSVVNANNSFGARAWYHSGWVFQTSSSDATFNRDPGSWEHWFIKQREDASNRYTELWINGNLYGQVANYVSAKNGYVNIMGMTNDDSRYWGKGSMADFHFLDGVDCDVTDFGRVNANGHWVPKTYTGGNNYASMLGESVGNPVDPERLFDGNTNTYTVADGSPGGSSIKFRPVGGLTVNSTLEVFLTNTINQTISVNDGVEFQPTGGDNQWVTVPFYGNLETIEFISQTAQAYVSAIRIDGTILEDGEGWGAQGAHLTFLNPNNVGEDTSGNGNDFTVVGNIITADATDPDYDMSYDSPTNTFAQPNGVFGQRAQFACRGGKAVRGAFATSTGLGMPLTGPKIASDATVYFECNITVAVATASWNSWTAGFYFLQDYKQQPMAGIDSTLLYNGSIDLAGFDIYGDVYANNPSSREDNQITTGSGFTGNAIMGVLIDQGNLTITCNGAPTNVTNMALNVNPDLDGNYNLFFYAYAGTNGVANWLKINTGQKDFRFPPQGVDYKRLCTQDLFEMEAIPVSQEHFDCYQGGPDNITDPVNEEAGNWSYYCTTNTNFSPSQPRTMGFDGNIGTGQDAVGQTGVYTKVIWAPQPPIDITGKAVRVYASNDDSDIMIGMETDPDTVSVSSSNTWVTVPPGVRTEISAATPLIIRRKQTSGSTGFNAIEIDSKVYTDGGVPALVQQKMPYGLYWSKDIAASADWQMWDYQGGANNTQPFGTGGVPGQVMRAYVDDTNPSAVYAWNAGETGINTDAGFSITTGAHGLLKKPELVISSNGYIWIQKFDDVDGNPTTYFSHLNDAYGYNAGRVLNGNWNVTSSNISCSDPQVDNKFYAWHSVEGFSKFGYWDTNPSGGGTGAIDGAYIHLGFQPAMVWIWYTAASSGDFHYIYSNNIKRSNSNVSECFMFGAGIGPIVSSYSLMDFTSDGFKLRSGSTYPNTPNMSWAAWAEMPASAGLPTRFYHK